MFVPLIIGAVITTICQGLLNFDLWETLGNPMKDMFSSSGQMLIIGLMQFCTGTQLKMSDIKDAMHRGVLLILVRLGVAYALLGFDGESGFGEAQVMQIISLIIPFILGMILGNMDEDIRKVFAGGNAIILTDPAMHPSQAARFPVLRSLSLQWRQHPTRRLSSM